MRINQQDNSIIIEEMPDFHLGQTLECGQCFHFEKIDENEYIVIAMGKFLHICQTGSSIIFFQTTMEEYLEIWEDYFDLKRDYGRIKSILLEKDEKLREAVEEKYGVRILNQDFFEVLISFIISQNKQIPHIKQIVSGLSQNYGKKAGSWNGKDYYAFPDAQRLSEVTEEEFRECKAGFRAPYLVDACKRVMSGQITKERLTGLPPEKIKEELLSIKGVGEKVANCVLLFGLSQRSAFPVDVWMERIMRQLYFQEDTKKEQIQQFAREQYGEYGGYAQQYLFYFAREKKEKMRKQ